MTTRILRIGRRYHFEAAHRLYSKALSQDENIKIFGKCARVGGHGHNYVVEILIEGEADPLSGEVMPREDMNARVKELLLDRVDHRNLEDVITDEVTTGENLAAIFFSWLHDAFGEGRQLVSLRVRETRNNLMESVGV